MKVEPIVLFMADWLKTICSSRDCIAMARNSS